jgi:2-hydroxychromene-2-carboxylate isomerase
VADFYLDYSSPYAYLAAARIDGMIPGATWRPIAFGALIRQIGKVPWSLGPGRAAGVREVEERARARGLPPVRWPDGWPDVSYSLLPLRAGLVAADAGRLREFSAAVYRLVFAEGRTLTEPGPVLAAAAAAGVDPDAVAAGLADPAIKARLRAETDAAIARGVTGVPTVAVGGALFWGDDRLEEAAAAAAAAA